MDFPIKKRKKSNIDSYKKKDIDVAYEFAKAAYKEFGQLLKGIILFGSTARKEKNTGDVDIMLILDDVTYEFSAELIQTYRIIIEKLIVKVSTKLHVTTLRFTSFWEYVRSGDPVAVNILRDGVALIDTGFFDPLQSLLYQGRIRPTPESMWTYYSRAPRSVDNAKKHVVSSAVDLYWGVIDAAHAALMKLDEVPPSPEHVADLMDEKMVRPGLIDKKYSQVMRDFYKLSKDLLHRNLDSVSGRQYDKLLQDAEEFIRVMKDFLDKE